MNSSSSPETSEKSQIDSGELRRWRIRQLDIPTQLFRLSVLVIGFLFFIRVGFSGFFFFRLTLLMIGYTRRLHPVEVLRALQLGAQT